MIGEVTKALGLYEGLDSVGKRLFREELGLIRPQQATKRRKRTLKPVDTEAVTPVRRTRRVQQPTADTGAPAV